MSGDLGDFFSLIGKAKQEKEDEFRSLVGEIDIDSIFKETKKSLKEDKKKKKKIEKQAKALESWLYSETKQEEKIETEDDKEVVNEIPEPLESSEPVVEEQEEPEEISEEIEEIPEDTVDHALKILETIKSKEEVQENVGDPEIIKIRRELEYLKNLVNAQGGGGEVRLEFLDDVDRDTALVDGKFLKYDSSSGKFVGASGGAGSQSLDDTLGIGNTSDFGMSVGVVTATSFSGNGINLTGIVTSIVAGSNVTISGATGAVTINASGGGGSGSIAGIDTTGTSFFNQLSISGVATATSFVGSLTGSASSLSGVSSSFLLDYNNFSNTPTIPTNNNQLTNGAGYITTSFTNTNQLTNGAGFITTSFTNTNQLTNGAGFITAGDNITGTAAGLSGNPNIVIGITTISTGIGTVRVGAGDTTLFVDGNARVTGILTIGTGSITLDPTSKKIEGIDEIIIGTANTITIKQDAKGEIEFTDSEGTQKSVGIGTTVSINTSGIITATTFVGSLTGSATSLSGVSSSFLLDYNNFSNTPTIPTNNNQLTNGAGFITTSFTNTNQLTNGAGFVTFTNNNQLTNGSGFITTSFTNTNQLTNGAGFITTSFTNTNQLTNGAGFITSSDDISGTSAGLSGSPNITVNAISATSAEFSGNVTIGGTLTYEDVTNIDSVGLVTARIGVNVTGGQIAVGAAFSVGQAGVVTATTFDGNLATSNLTGTITNAQLAGSIANAKLANSSIAIGGITFNLGDTDATPAFDLSDATDYPFTSLTGITTVISGDTTPTLGGNLDANSKDITGINNINVSGVATATTFVGSLTGSASSLSGVSSSFLLDYNNFTNTPTIPTNNNQLTNGAGFITTSFTNTNQLTNGAGFITTSFTNTNQLTNGAGFITSSDNISGTAAGLSGSPDIAVTNITSGIVTATSFVGGKLGISGLSTSKDLLVTGITSATNIIEIKSSDSTPGRINFYCESNNSHYTQLKSAAHADYTGIATVTLPTSTGTLLLSDGSGASLTALNASNLGSGTVPDARFPSTLPAVSGENLTSVDAATLDGVDSTSFLRSDAADTKTSGDLTFSDDVKAKFGDGSDLEIYSNGSVSFIKESGSGNLKLLGNNIVVKDTSDSEFYADFNKNGSADLYYDNSKKFETTGAGVVVTGIATATTFSGSGANLTNLPSAQLTGALPAIDGSNLTGITAEGTGAIGGLTIKNQSGSTVGTAGSVSTIDFNGSSGVTVTATSGASGIATVVVSAEVVSDTTPQLGGNLDVNGKSITGTGNVNLTGIVTATSFHGDGSNLTNAGASAAKSSAIAGFLGR